jgi:TP901 family phage tail tape measure protein
VAGEAVVVIRLEDKASGALDKIDGSAKTLSGRFKNLAKGALARLGALTAGAFAASKAFNELKNLSEAEGALRSLGVNADNATATFAKLSSELKGQASTVELTAAAYDVASAGFGTIAEQTEILRAATKGAVGGMSDLNTVGNAVTSVLNSYGMEASEASKLVDQFIQTQNDGKIIIEQYANQIGRLAPTAAAAGVGIDEVNAAISAITAKGVAPEQTITGLNMALVALLKPSGEASKLAKSLGIEFNETALKSKGFGGVLKDVVKRTKGNTTQMTKLFGSVDALKAVLALTSDDLETFEANLKKQRDAAGVADKAFEDMSSTLSGALKGLDSAFKNLIVAFKPVMPAIVKPIELLAAGIQLAADNFKKLAVAAAFFGTLAAFAKASAIAQGLLAAKTALLAVKTKVAAVAAAALQLIMNPANIGKIAVALTVAAGTAVALGVAMDSAAGKAEEGQKKVKEAATGTTEELKKQEEATKNAAEAKERSLAAAKSSLEFATKEKEQIKAQQAAYENTINVTSARLNAEKEINKLQGAQLQAAYEMAGSAARRLQIAKDIFQNDVEAARIKHQQAINEIEAARQSLEFKRQGAIIDGKILKARGEMAIAEADGLEAKKAAQTQAQKALDSQMQAIRLIDNQIKAQGEVAEYQKQAAEAQFKANILAAEQSLKQKLVSDEIGLSQTQANNLARELGQGAIKSTDLNTGMSQVKTSTEQTSIMMIRVATNAERAATAINNAAAAQRNLNAARAQGGGGSAQGAAQGAYWPGGFQAFAKGGMVTGPTLGLIGEGGEPEYIIPQSKAAGFAANYLSGQRGAGAIPAFADGGYVGPSSASVSIQTGPVTQMDGTNYVTTKDLGRAVQAGVNQTLDLIRRDGNTRAALGLS